MDALSQLSYTPVAEQNRLRMVWQTETILTNLTSKFHTDEPLVGRASACLVWIVTDPHLNQTG